MALSPGLSALFGGIGAGAGAGSAGLGQSGVSNLGFGSAPLLGDLTNTSMLQSPSAFGGGQQQSGNGLFSQFMDRYKTNGEWDMGKIDQASRSPHARYGLMTQPLPNMDMGLPSQAQAQLGSHPYITPIWMRGRR